MASGVRELAARSIEERWRSLSNAVADIDFSQPTPTSAQHLARFVRAAVAFCSEQMIAFARSPEPLQMTDQEFADATEVAASSYKTLMRILHLISPQNTGAVPLELSESLG